MSPALEQIERARAQLSRYIFHTPLVTNDLLNCRLHCTVFWKLENLQQTGSFKVRGALSRVLTLNDDERTRGLAAVSSGNHGIGVSFAANAVNLPATIFMPVNAPRVKQEMVKQFGAYLIQQGSNYNETLVAAEGYVRAHQLTLISSFDDPWVIAGQGTLGLEILEDVEDIDDLLIPIGGGGLAAGIGIALKALRPSIRLYGVQPSAAPSCYQSRLAQKQITTLPTQTLADGLVCVKPGTLTFPIIQSTIHDILLVDELSIAEAVRSLLTILKVLVEPAGAVTLAAIATHPEIFSGRRVACILSGGNIDHDVLNQILRTEAT